MLPPPEGFFSSWENLVEHASTFGATQGDAIVTGKGTDKKAGKMFLLCDRGEIYENKHKILEGQHLRQKSSRKCECKFKLSGRKRPDGTWELMVKNGKVL